MTFRNAYITLRRAATLLEQEARCLRESYCVPPAFDRWPLEETETMEHHDEMIALARELLRLAQALSPCGLPPK